ncbi:MAG TPA: glycoside hydrolase family 25 protein [Actinomycetota bacterium]|nr:glycoside hydrolase family 25 protein [Actinomycetota bacterium]
MANAKLVDMSSHQPSVDFHAVKKGGFIGVVCRTGIGESTPDTSLDAHREGARSAGLHVGYYHVLSSKAADAQAEFFLSLARPQRGDLLAADLEPGNPSLWEGMTAGAILDVVRAFVQAVRHAAPHNALLLYTYESFWATTMGNPHDDLGCDLWIAAYATDYKPYVPAAWERRGPKMWQFTDGTHPAPHEVPGIPGPCDQDMFLGSADDYRRYVGA